MATPERQDRAYMARALQLAERGLYTTDPNPRVGCVLVKDDEIVGEGYHRRAGEPHAERMALAAAGENARGSTAYVTLEPCSHHGKTPPCSDGLIEAGVSRVVAAMKDPNPLVSGSGLKQLADAGIDVHAGLLEEQARALNPGFIKRMETGLPYVRCKLAMSLDGRTAMAGGESKWITSDASRRDVHRLRARSSAIVTGIGTLLADNPSLNVRLEAADLPGVDDAWEILTPLRVVVDSDLKTPADAKLLKLPGDKLIATTVGESVSVDLLMASDAEVIHFEGDRVPLRELMASLAEREVNEVLIETGATLAGAALEAGIIDELVVYVAPHLMGSDARGLLNLQNIETMEQRIKLKTVDMRQIGPDIRLTFQPAQQSGE